MHTKTVLHVHAHFISLLKVGRSDRRPGRDLLDDISPYMACIRLEGLGLGLDPLYSASGYAVMPPTMGGDHSLFHEFPYILGDRLWRDSQFLGDFLLAYGRLMFCDLHENLEPRDLPLAAQERREGIIICHGQGEPTPDPSHQGEESASRAL